MFLQTNVQPADTRLRTAMSEYEATSSNWFKGDTASLDQRILANRGLMHQAKAHATKSPHWLEVVAELEVDARALASLREDVITSAQHREAYAAGETFADHKFDSGDGGRCKWCKDDAKHENHQHTAATADEARWIELEAPKLVRANLDADRAEMGIRAASFAHQALWKLSPMREAAVTHAFVQKCSSLVAAPKMTRQANRAESFTDFNAALLYL